MLKYIFENVNFWLAVGFVVSAAFFIVFLEIREIARKNYNSRWAITDWSEMVALVSVIAAFALAMGSSFATFLKGIL